MDNQNRIIDLSHDIIDYLPVYPGDEETRLFQTQWLNSDHYNNHRLEISMHSGTHIDTPMHLTEYNEYLSELPLEKFIGSGVVIDVCGESVIGMKPEYQEKIHHQDIVLFYTGWAKFFGSEYYFNDHPVVSQELTNFLIEHRVKMIGLDTPSPDKTPFEIHKLLFQHHILIIENLKDLDRLLNWNSFEVLAIPLKIRADSSPARILARKI